MEPLTPLELDILDATLCPSEKKKRYISPEWLKRKRCELKLSRSNGCGSKLLKRDFCIDSFSI